jgi:hypothetical protein
MPKPKILPTHYAPDKPKLLPTHYAPDKPKLLPTHYAPDKPQYGKKTEFHCPSGSSYSCAPGSERGCGDAKVNQLCCSSDAKEKRACPFDVKSDVGGKKQTFVCSGTGESYSCYPGSLGCGPNNPSCCLLGAGSCPFELTPALPRPPPPSPADLDVTICLHAHGSLCPLILEACASMPQNPLCMKALEECPVVIASMDRSLEAPWAF